MLNYSTQNHMLRHGSMQKHHSGSDTPPCRFQVSVSKLYFTLQRLYSFWGLIWSSEERGLVWKKIQSEFATISLPKVTARSEIFPSHWKKTRVGGRRRTPVKAQKEAGEWRERATPLAFSALPSDSAVCFFYWHIFFSVSGSTGSADLEMERAQQQLALNTFTGLSGDRHITTMHMKAALYYINSVNTYRAGSMSPCMFRVKWVCEAAAASFFLSFFKQLRV